MCDEYWPVNTQPVSRTLATDERSVKPSYQPEVSPVSATWRAWWRSSAHMASIP